MIRAHKNTRGTMTMHTTTKFLLIFRMNFRKFQCLFSSLTPRLPSVKWTYWHHMAIIGKILCSACAIGDDDNRWCWYGSNNKDRCYRIHENPANFFSWQLKINSDRASITNVSHRIFTLSTKKMVFRRYEKMLKFNL